MMELQREEMDSPSPPPANNLSEIEHATETSRPENPESETSTSNPNCSMVDGVYTYTDPGSGNEFKWEESLQQWKPFKVSGNLVTFDGTTYNYTDAQDGTTFEYDSSKSAWFPKLDEEFLVRYQLSYGLDSATKPVSIPDSQPSAAAPQKPAVSKVDKSLKRKAPNPAEWFDLDDAQNTKVYVSNLPLDITEEEFMEFMSKCGLVMKDPVSGHAKMKLYTDPEGNIKGDGLCTYIKIESVQLALQILDGFDLRGRKVSVERAQFQLKGAYDPTKKPKSKKRKDKDKMKKMQEKLFEWKPEKMRGERSKHERIVVVQNAFSPSDFDADVSLILEYQQDFREEAGKCGTCKKVVVFDRHPEGILQIYMTTPEVVLEGGAAESSLGNSVTFNVTKNGEVAIPLQVKPGSNFNCVTDVSPECVTLKISAPPVDGEANLAIVKFFSDLLGIRKADLQLSRLKSKQKTLLVSIAGTNHTPGSIMAILRKETGIHR